MCSTSARRLARAGRRHTGGEHATHCSAAPQAPIDQAVAGSGVMRRVMWTLCIRTRTHSFHEARIRTSPLSAAPLLRESPLFHQLLHPFAQRVAILFAFHEPAYLLGDGVKQRPLFVKKRHVWVRPGRNGRRFIVRNAHPSRLHAFDKNGAR